MTRREKAQLETLRQQEFYIVIGCVSVLATMSTDAALKLLIEATACGAGLVIEPKSPEFLGWTVAEIEPNLE